MVGAGIAVASGLVVLVSLFVDWYRQPLVCTFVPCPVSVRSGWSALGLSSAVLVLAAVAAALPLVGVLAGGRAARALAALAVVAGLGAALLVVFRIAVPPGSVIRQARLAGPFIALMGTVGVAGGSVLAGIGPRIFEPVKRSAPPIAAILTCCGAIIVSLFLPWVRRPGASIEVLPRHVGGAVQSAWAASPALAVLLLLGALAIVCASLLVAVIRWRAAFFALAAGGWIAAAMTAAVTPIALQLPLPGVAEPGLSAYEAGYYLCLASAGAIALTGLSTAVLIA